MIPISQRIIDELASARRAKKVSAQALADRMTEIGYPIERSVLANCEGHRRRAITIDHLVIACRALGISPVELLIRCGNVQCPGCNGTPPAGFTCNTCGGGR